MSEYEPNPIITARAAKLWRRALENPVYDNGDNSFRGFMAQGLAGMLPKNNTPEVLDKFEAELVKLLHQKMRFTKDHQLEPSYHGIYQSSMHVDYGADVVLRTAAEAAGLKMEFPWKSHMYLRNDHLSVNFGYGAGSVYHYPLDDEGQRWLITSLYGDAIDTRKLLDSVRHGNPLGLFVEEPAPVAG